MEILEDVARFFFIWNQQGARLISSKATPGASIVKRARHWFSAAATRNAPGQGWS
jgi:hypothetical protein